VEGVQEPHDRRLDGCQGCSIEARANAVWHRCAVRRHGGDYAPSFVLGERSEERFRVCPLSSFVEEVDVELLGGACLAA